MANACVVDKGRGRGGKAVSVEIVLCSGRWCWSVIFNTRDRDSSQSFFPVTNGLSRVLWDMIDGVSMMTSWACGDALYTDLSTWTSQQMLPTAREGPPCYGTQ